MECASEWENLEEKLSGYGNGGKKRKSENGSEKQMDDDGLRVGLKREGKGELRRGGGDM